jgi:hypothetical protein
MQYILTEQEYKELKNLPAKIRAAENKELMKFCRMVSNTLPVTHGRLKGQVWGCILDEDPNGKGDWDCDNCPSVEVCPYDNKSFSK